MKTMEWPPVVRGGRTQFVDGPVAAATLIIQTVGDLRQNPFNPSGLSLGDLTFKGQTTAKARISLALQRLSATISVEAILEQASPETGDLEYTIIFLDRETKTKGEVRVG